MNWQNQANLIMRPSICCFAQTIYIWPFVYLEYLSIERSSLDIVGPVLQHIRPCRPTEKTRVSKALCAIGQTTSNIKHQWLYSNYLVLKYFCIIGLKLINIHKLFVSNDGTALTHVFTALPRLSSTFLRHKHSGFE